MNWKQAFTSSVGKKLVMGFTGLFLITFLLVHAYVNGLVFLEWLDPGRGYSAYKEGAHFLGTNPLTRIAEIGLILGIILHIVQGLMLWSQNKSKRPVSYSMQANGSNSNYPKAKTTWYSRSMGLLGTLILIFLVLHLYHFWAPNRMQQLLEGREKDLYYEMQVVFSEWWVVAIYVLGCISLAWHLAHGFFSAFRTVGLTTPRYNKMIKNIGVAYSIIIPLFFILMPISFKLGLLPDASQAKENAKIWAAH